MLAVPCPSLEIRISAWDIILFGRGPVLAEIAARLQTYEDEIEAKGLREYPSALNVHARLWFEHYIHGRKYPELIGECQLVNLESIKRVVWRFTEFLGISVKK